MTKLQFENLKVGDKVQQRTYDLISIPRDSILTIKRVGKIEKGLQDRRWLDIEVFEVSKDEMFSQETGEEPFYMCFTCRQLKLISKKHKEQK